ncbi:MAG: hypothetical protein DMF61_13170 [Blastocatellia bacterium AA13]|nr:MAG: hypothetical protein DMF61_13170 [Blastocatellia bacterium AA13]
MPEKKHWIITASGDRSLRDLKKKLTESGFTVDQELEEIGIITGTADDRIAEKVRLIPGIADVSPDIPVEIGPPDAATW